MQNLRITTNSPAAAAQAPAPEDNGAAQAAEPFGNMLARQIADAPPPANGLPALSSTGILSAAANEKPVELHKSAPNEASTLPADILAALLPASVSKDTIATNEKPDPQAPIPDGISALPADMLTSLLPTPANMRGAGESLRQQPLVTSMHSGARQAARSPAAPTTQGNIPSSAPNGRNSVPVGNNAFAAMLEASGENSTSTALSADTPHTAQIPAQPGVAALPTLTQTATAHVAASPNTPVQAAVNTPLAHEKWGAEFNQKITWLATQHGQSAELHLNPPHLGPLDVVLKVIGDQATALFSSPHAAVREAVAQALPQLREMMANNGIMLGNATVSDQAPREQQAGLADKGQSSGRVWPNTADGVIPADGIKAGGAAQPARRHQGMVDTFA